MNVLAIDDSTTIRHMLKLCLEGAGFNVTLAEDGIKGLQKLQEVTPDVVITDINMPNLDGFGVLSAIRSDTSLVGLPVIILTTENADELKNRARASGATGWVVKPFDDRKLIAALKRVTAD